MNFDEALRKAQLSGRFVRREAWSMSRASRERRRGNRLGGGEKVYCRVKRCGTIDDTRGGGVGA
jgi:hypothetical protein